MRAKVKEQKKQVIAPRKRPRELEDGLNFYLYHPLSWRLARLLAHTPLTPNMVSVLGGGFVVAAGIAYAQPLWPWSALIGMALHMSWHVVDGADGDLARITERTSPRGEMIDGLCDYTSHIVLYLILGGLLARQIGHAGWLVMLAAGLSHIIQANHVEVQRRSYQWWIYATPWLRQTRTDAEAITRRGISGFLVSFYLRTAARLARSTTRIDALFEADNTQNHNRLRQAILGESHRLLRVLKLLGPNSRAVLLGLSMLIGSPLWYFLFEVIALNLLLLISLRLHDLAAVRIETSLKT